MEIIAAEINGTALKRKAQSREDLHSKSPAPPEKISRKSGSPLRLQNGHKDNNGSAHSGDTTEEEDNNVDLLIDRNLLSDNGKHNNVELEKSLFNKKCRTNGETFETENTTTRDEVFFPHRATQKTDLEKKIKLLKQISEFEEHLRNEEIKLILMRKLQQSQLQPVASTCSSTAPTSLITCSNKENKEKLRPSSPAVLETALQLTNKSGSAVSDKKRSSISKESPQIDRRYIAPVTTNISTNGSVKQENVSLQQRQAAAKLALRKQLEKSLLSIPPPKAPPPEMHFVPNGNSAEFICLLGLETVVTFLKEGYETTKGIPPAPFVCVQCKGDFTPVWKWQHIETSGKKNKSPSVICENCVSQNMKKALKAEHTNRLKATFVKALQQEQELEAQMAMGVSPPPSLQMPSPSPSPKPHGAVSQQQTSVNNVAHRTSSPLSTVSNAIHGGMSTASTSSTRHHSTSPHHSRSSTTAIQEQQSAAAVMAAAAASMQNSLLAGSLGGLMGLGSIAGTQNLPSTSRGSKGKNKASTTSAASTAQNTFASHLSKLSAAQQQALLQAQAQQFLQQLMNAATQTSRGTSNQQAAAAAAALMNPLMNPLLQAYSLSLLQNTSSSLGNSAGASPSTSSTSGNNSSAAAGSSIAKSAASDLQRQYLLDMIPPSSRSSSWK